MQWGLIVLLMINDLLHCPTQLLTSGMRHIHPKGHVDGIQYNTGPGNCLGCVLVHYPVSRLIFSLNMASCHFGCFLPPKPPIFGPTWTWMGHKSAQNISLHCLGCVSAHYPVSRWIFCSTNYIYAYFKLEMHQ